MVTLKQVAKNAGLSPLRTVDGNYDATDALMCLFKHILKVVDEGDEVRIPEFGTFSVRVIKGKRIEHEKMRGGFIEWSDKKVLRFKQGNTARLWLNDPEKETDIPVPDKARRKGVRAKPVEEDEIDEIDEIDGDDDGDEIEVKEKKSKKDKKSKKSKKSRKEKKKDKKAKAKAKAVSPPVDEDDEDSEVNGDEDDGWADAEEEELDGDNGDDVADVDSDDEYGE